MDTSRLTPEGEIHGEDVDETHSLKAMLHEAKEYLSSFHWASTITEAYMGIGIGGVLAVFLFRFAEGIGKGADEYLWVVVGDLPSAFFVVDDAPSAVKALKVYCDLMTDWANAAKQGTSLEDVFPVNAPANVEFADMLLSRIRFIRERIIPQYQ